ncbi:peptidase M23, partial [Bacillus velezensis]
MKVLLSALLLFSVFCPAASGKEQSALVSGERMQLYRKAEAVTQIPWYVLAAVDQHEENVRSNRKELSEKAG